MNDLQDSLGLKPGLVVALLDSGARRQLNEYLDQFLMIRQGFISLPEPLNIVR